MIGGAAGASPGLKSDDVAAPAGATFKGKLHDVFYPGLQPKLRAAGMESCYRIPSLLYVPPRAGVTHGADGVSCGW